MKTKVYNNDVFISYRRNKGEAWASLIKELLEKKALKVYLDKHKKRTIDFKESLLRNINESNMRKEIIKISLVLFLMDMIPQR